MGSSPFLEHGLVQTWCYIHNARRYNIILCFAKVGFFTKSPQYKNINIANFALAVLLQRKLKNMWNVILLHPFMSNFTFTNIICCKNANIDNFVCLWRPRACSNSFITFPCSFPHMKTKSHFRKSWHKKETYHHEVIFRIW